MRFGGVIVDGGGGLGAEVAGFRVEIERADAVGAVIADEFDAVLDALGAIGLHWFDCSCPSRECRHSLVGRRK